MFDAAKLGMKNFQSLNQYAVSNLVLSAVSIPPAINSHVLWIFDLTFIDFHRLSSTFILFLSFSCGFIVLMSSLVFSPFLSSLRPLFEFLSFSSASLLLILFLEFSLNSFYPLFPLLQMYLQCWGRVRARASLCSPKICKAQAHCMKLWGGDDSHVRHHRITKW